MTVGPVSFLKKLAGGRDPGKHGNAFLSLAVETEESMMLWIHHSVDTACSLSQESSMFSKM